MNYRSLVVTLLVVGTVLAAQPINAEFRVATVDMGRILNESKEAQGRKRQLDEVTLAAKKKIEERQLALQAREKKLREQKVTENSKEAEKFRNDAREFTRFVKDTEEEIKKTFLKSNRDLTEKALKIVEARASSSNYSIVLERSARGRSSVLFADETFDITDSVLKALDAQ
jgi:Skp family chaperone for outer membrane proteins